MTEDEARLIERQQRLEVEMVQVGIENWRAAERRKEAQANKRGETALAETTPGKRMMATLLPKVTAAVKAKQQEALDTLTNSKGGRPVLWAGPVLCLSAEKIAVIVIRTTITDVHQWVQGLALMIADRCALEREYELIVEAERQRVKDGRVSAYEQARGFEKPVSVIDLMKEYARTVDARTLKKWAAKLDHVEKMEWTTEERLSFGCMCLQVLVESAPDWFQEVEYTARSRGQIQTNLYVALTPEAEAYIKHHKELDEAAHPWLIPMIAPPAPWTKEG